MIIKTLEMNNNESQVKGIFETDGEFLVLTYSKSKTFKTLNGALGYAFKIGLIDGKAPQGCKIETRQNKYGLWQYRYTGQVNTYWTGKYADRIAAALAGCICN